MYSYILWFIVVADSNIEKSISISRDGRKGRGQFCRILGRCLSGGASAAALGPRPLLDLDAGRFDHGLREPALPHGTEPGVLLLVPEKASLLIEPDGAVLAGEMGSPEDPVRTRLELDETPGLIKGNGDPRLDVVELAKPVLGRRD